MLLKFGTSRGASRTPENIYEVESFAGVLDPAPGLLGSTFQFPKYAKSYMQNSISEKVPKNSGNTHPWTQNVKRKLNVPGTFRRRPE